MVECARRAVPFARPADRPAVVAHGAGNAVSGLERSVGEGADYVEVDLWVRNGRFEARHERRPLPLPVLVEQWYLRLAPRRPVDLEAVLRRLRARAGVFLDLKNGGARAAELLRATLDRFQPEVPVAVSSQWWYILREVAARCPEVTVLYSVDVPAKLALFFSVVEHDPVPVGMSCRAELLTPEVVERAHGRGLAVVAWTVDDPNWAAELARMGVDGITTHRVREIRGVLEGQANGRDAT